MSDSDDPTTSPADKERAEPFDAPVTDSEEPQSERGAAGSRGPAGSGEATTKREPDPETEEHTAADQPGVNPKPVIDEDMTYQQPGD